MAIIVSVGEPKTQENKTDIDRIIEMFEMNNKTFKLLREHDAKLCDAQILANTMALNEIKLMKAIKS